MTGLHVLRPCGVLDCVQHARDWMLMDFLKILKSFEEFVYEALSWFVLLPKTLMRILWRPTRMFDYAAAEMGKEEKVRYNDAISPPLLLILCVLIAHFFDLAMRAQTPDPATTLAATLLASEQNLLLYRTLAFGLWALAGAVYLLLRTGRVLTRDSLRVPFYQQCYLVAPFALTVSIATSCSSAGGIAEIVGACLVIVSVLWFWFAQSRWMQQTSKLPLWRSVIAAIFILLIGAAANGVLAHVLLSEPAEATSRVESAS